MNSFCLFWFLFADQTLREAGNNWRQTETRPRDLRQLYHERTAFSYARNDNTTIIWLITTSFFVFWITLPPVFSHQFELIGIDLIKFVTVALVPFLSIDSYTYVMSCVSPCVYGTCGVTQSVVSRPFVRDLKRRARNSWHKNKICSRNSRCLHAWEAELKHDKGKGKTWHSI